MVRQLYRTVANTTANFVCTNYRLINAFFLACAIFVPLIVYNGVESGIEKVSRFMMPFIALLSTILIGWIKTPDYVIGEMERNGEHFRRKSVYRVMIRYIAPVMMLILFLQSTGILS